MKDFLVGAVGFEEDLGDLLFDLGGGAGGLGDVLDQITRILQEGFDLGNIGEIIFAGFAGGRNGQVTRFLNEQAGTPDALGGENQTRHAGLLDQLSDGNRKERVRKNTNIAEKIMNPAMAGSMIWAEKWTVACRLA